MSIPSRLVADKNRTVFFPPYHHPICFPVRSFPFDQTILEPSDSFYATPTVPHLVSTPGSRYYADVAGIRVPIFSSVSLTSESSASVRSSKGKLQLGDVSPIERTQTNRTRIVIGGVMSGCAASAIRSTIRTLSSSPLFVEEDRPVFVSLYQRIEAERVRPGPANDFPDLGDSLAKACLCLDNSTFNLVHSHACRG